MLTRLYIDNFRCFTNFELRPERINLLLGANGAGKSSLFDVVFNLRALILDGAEVANLFTRDDLTKWDTRSEQRFELSLVHLGRSFRYSVSLTYSEREGGMAIGSERVEHDGNLLFRYEDGRVHLHRNDGTEGAEFAFRGNRSFLAGIEERPETEYLLSFLRGLRNLNFYKLNPLSMGSVTHEEQEQMKRDGSNFASWYRHLAQEHAGSLSGLFEHLELAIPGLCALNLKGAGQQGRTRDLIAEMRSQDGAKYEIEFDALSDGQRVLVALYSILLDASRDRIFFLDEPENFVGLAELRPWLHELDEALGEKGQLFLISHHPEVIDFLAPENPIFLERPQGGPVRVRDPETTFHRDGGLKASEQIIRGLASVG